MEVEVPGEAEKLSPQEEADLISLIRLRYQAGEGADMENRRLHTEDLAFVFDAESGAQWDPLVLGLRKGRPSYTFNRVLQPVNMLLGDQRQSAPSIKVRPIKGGSQAVADVLGGLWRSIEQDSRAEEVYAGTYKHAVAGGYGEMRLVPEYESDDSMDQVLRIKHIPNPLTVIRDPESTDPWGADQMWCMVGDRISKEKYEAEYPGDLWVNFEMSRDGMGWRTDGMVRVVEYFEKIPVDKEIAQLSDGRIIDYTDKEKSVEEHLQAEGVEAATVVRTRKVRGWKVRWLKCDGARILEGPIVYDWKRIPIVRMPGRYVNIEGRQKYQSLIRHSKDSQRTYNFQSSDAIERSALVPKARYFVTPKMIVGFEDLWNSSNTQPRIYMPYNIDPAAPNGGMPFREQPIDVPQGAVAMAQKAAQDIQATTGFFDPALGNADDMNRVSGKALVTHTRRSDLGSHEFISNYASALKLLAMCGFDMIPTIYDTERVVRIIGQDGIDKLVQINGQQGDGQIINDLKSGTYDCDVTLGPSYETARQETLAMLIDAAETIPAIASVAPDLIARAMDSPDSDELAKRLRVGLIHQGIIQPTQQDQENMGPPPPPNPLQVAQLQQQQGKAAKIMADAHIAASKASSGDLYIHERVIEVAGKHLANMLQAKELGQPQDAAIAEAQAALPLRPNIPAAPGAQVIPGQ
jgi:Phage P22-like portal protein